MAYTAIKPCRFAGQSFRIGDTVPAEVIQPGAAKNLVKMGIIAESGSVINAAPIKTVKAPVNKVVIHSKGMDLSPTPRGLQEIFDVLTANVSAAETIISEMTDDDALILLNISDSRKSVKELTEARAKALSTEGEESEGDL